LASAVLCAAYESTLAVATIKSQALSKDVGPRRVKVFLTGELIRYLYTHIHIHTHTHTYTHMQAFYKDVGPRRVKVFLTGELIGYLYTYAHTHTRTHIQTYTHERMHRATTSKKIPDWCVGRTYV